MNQEIKGLDNHELLVAFSTTTPEALLHVHYDQIDEKNHKSLNSLVHVLNDSGYHDIATILEKQEPYVVFANPVLAARAREFVNDHSAAVYTSLYYKGHINAEAVALIEKNFPKAREEHQHNLFKIKH